MAGDPHAWRVRGAAIIRIRGGEYVAFDRADLKEALRIWMAAAEAGEAEAAAQNKFVQTPQFKSIKGAGHELGDFFFCARGVESRLNGHSGEESCRVQ